MLLIRVARGSRNAKMDIFLPEWVAGVDFEARPPTLVRRGPIRGSELLPIGDLGGAALFEGFLYGRSDLLVELGLAAESSDTRLVIEAWRRWGDSFPDHLDGSFLTAIWDAENERLLVGHDALGHHPVYFHRSHSGFWFSTNVLALAHCGVAPLVPDRLSLAMLLQLSRTPRGRTFFEGIERLGPGRFLEVRSSNRVREAWRWNPVPEDEEACLPEGEVLERFEPMLLRSVAHRMDLEPHGIMLSGGLDSVCVAALAKEFTQERRLPTIVAYSGRHHPDDPPSYEEDMQDRVVDALGMQHHTSNELDWLGGRDLISASLEEMQQFPCPTWIFWTGGYMGFARRAAGAGHTRLLTGSGGDEWLSVDPSYASDLLRRLSFRRLVQFVQADTNGGGRALSEVLRYQLWSWGLRPLLASTLERVLPGLVGRYLDARDRRRIPDDLMPDRDLSSRVREVVASRRLPLLDRGGKILPSFYRESLRSVWRDSYVIQEREISYHAQRRAGALYFSPYHDRRLLEFLCRVPPHLLFRGSRYKGMIRDVARQRLPGLGLGEQRKIYPREGRVSTRRALVGNLGRLGLEIGLDRLMALDLVAAEGVQNPFDNLRTVGHHSLVKTFSLLSAEVWLRANFERLSRSGKPQAGDHDE